MEKELAEAFGGVVKQYRVKNGLTQEGLAFNTELHRTYISLLERGKRQPTLNTIFLLASEFDCTPAELIQAVQDSYC